MNTINYNPLDVKPFLNFKTEQQIASENNIDMALIIIAGVVVISAAVIYVNYKTDIQRKVTLQKAD